MTDRLRSGVGRHGAGFSLIEVMLVVAIIGILVNLAVPVYSEARLRAEAAAVVGDARAVATAVGDYYLSTRTWPEDASVGEAPPELASFLGDQIDWSVPHEYDYDYFADADGDPTQAESGVLVGFSLRNADPRLVAIIQAAEPGPITQTWGNGVTFIVQSVDGRGAVAVP